MLQHCTNAKINTAGNLSLLYIGNCEHLKLTMIPIEDLINSYQTLARDPPNIQSTPSIVTPDIVTSPLISTFTLAQVANKLIKKTPSLVTPYSIFIITTFFFGPEGCDYRGGRLYIF